MLDRAPSAKQERAALTAQLRSQGKSWGEVAEVFRKRYKVTYLIAFRLAHGLSQQDVIDIWNDLWPDRRPKTARNLSTWERWPYRSGHEPSLTTLSRLAQIYQCSVSDLLADWGDYRHLDNSDQAKGAQASTPNVDNSAIDKAIVWIGESGCSDFQLEQINQAASYLAEAHSKVPAKKVLSEVLGLHQRTQELLVSRKKRIRQTRELLRINSNLLAHACLLFGDLGQNEKAMEYGRASLLYAQEAETNEAIAWSVQAKTARWQERYVDSAELARRGFEASANSPVKVELAYREANAIALFGDVGRAREALRRAEKTADALLTDDTGSSVWAFPPERQAVFAQSVAIHTGDPDSALRVAEFADAQWKAGEVRVPAAWAQIRVGAGIAYMMKGALDGAVEQISPVLDLPPELRIVTVVGYLRKLDRLLMDPSYSRSPIAVEIRERIREFAAATPMDGYIGQGS
jgi:tetratricopeptide (TPR) repeat protein